MLLLRLSLMLLGTAKEAAIVCIVLVACLFHIAAAVIMGEVSCRAVK